MKIAIAIETKDRRLHGGQNYLGQTLINLERAGVMASPHLHSLHIVSGGELPDFFDVEVVQPFMGGTSYQDLFWSYVEADPAGVTRQQNGAAAIRVAASTDADWVMKLEDDLDFTDDFLGNVTRWLADVGHLSVPMFVLGATFQRVSESKFQPGETLAQPGPSFPRVRASMREGAKYMLHPIPGWYAAQALLWKQPVARQLARWLGNDPYLWDGKEQHRNRGHDLLLQVWGQEVGGRAFAVTCPSFVQHIGRTSNLDQPEINHRQPFFEFPWLGRDWRYGDLQSLS